MPICGAATGLSLLGSFSSLPELLLDEGDQSGRASQIEEHRTPEGDQALNHVGAGAWIDVREGGAPHER